MEFFLWSAEVAELRYDTITEMDNLKTATVLVSKQELKDSFPFPATQLGAGRPEMKSSPVFNTSHPKLPTTKLSTKICSKDCKMWWSASNQTWNGIYQSLTFPHSGTSCKGKGRWREPLNSKHLAFFRQEGSFQMFPTTVNLFSMFLIKTLPATQSPHVLEWISTKDKMICRSKHQTTELPDFQVLRTHNLSPLARTSLSLKS